jgi:hypothetical protein
MSDYVLSNGRDADDVCPACKAGWHGSCEYAFDGQLEAVDSCCCGEEYRLREEIVAMLKAELAGQQALDGVDVDSEAHALAAAAGTGQTVRGNSGYIHPEAWPSRDDIGTLKDPQSTGRKRVAKLYPIPVGKMCEWAMLAAAGGGIEPIVGCAGYPATDLHHGPDKNTLNNAKASLGIGTTENVHLICSMCHNTWHAANDPYYPKTGRGGTRDYVADQATPFVPLEQYMMSYVPHDGETKTDSPRTYTAEEFTRGRERGHQHTDDDFDADDE